MNPHVPVRAFKAAIERALLDCAAGARPGDARRWCTPCAAVSTRARSALPRPKPEADDRTANRLPRSRRLGVGPLAVA